MGSPTPDGPGTWGGAAAPGPGRTSLESIHNVVTTPNAPPEPLFEVARCRCESWFCEHCATSKGLRVRARLTRRLEEFTAVFMVTLTVDPSLFPDPKAAYLYIRDRRAIARLRQDLHRWGHLHSRSCFYVVEFQRESQQAHFHLLLDASFIPKSEIDRAWSKYRPESAGPVVGDRPPFGTCRFSAPKFADASHAANYATKYLIKWPEHGFPDWVLDMGSDKRVMRYSVSRGFWDDSPPRSASTDRTEPRQRARARTYRERAHDCGKSANLFALTKHADRETGEESITRHWISKEQIDNAVIPHLPRDAGPVSLSRTRVHARNAQELRLLLYQMQGCIMGVEDAIGGAA